MATLSIFIISLLVCILLRVPIAFSLGTTACILLFLTGVPSVQACLTMFSGINSFPLLAVPFFMLVGEIMSRGGIAKRLIDLANAIVGFLPGGLALVNVMASMFFGGISGSSMADSAAIGGILIPSMKKDNVYSSSYAAAVTASSATIGIIIPPSIPFILYGVITGTSIAALFIGGILPGLIVGFALMSTSYYTSKRRGFGLAVHRFSLLYLVQTLKGAVLSLLIPGIVIGGILFGIFTATEAAVIVVFYSLFLSMTLYQEMSFRDLGAVIIRTVKMSAGILLIVAFASVCSTLLTIAQIPQQLALFISHLSNNPYAVMIIVNVFLLVVGCVMDLAASLLILAPLLLPVVENLGVSPVYFGVVMCVNLGIGLITPPVGNILYVVMGIAETDITSLMRDMAPFYVTLALLLLMLIFAPQIVMLLPNLLVK